MLDVCHVSERAGNRAFFRRVHTEQRLSSIRIAVPCFVNVSLDCSGSTGAGGIS